MRPMSHRPFAATHPGRAWTAGLVLLCAGAFWLLAGHVRGSLPYPHNIDEPFVTAPADRMIVQSTLHPSDFAYPSLPRYLAAAAMAAGFFESAANQEINTVQRIGETAFPFYKVPRVVGMARLLWVLIATLILLATGAAAWLTFRAPSTMVLAPFALLITPLFFAHAWTYLNVDLVGTAFVMATLVACVRSTYRPSVVACAVVPGALAGLAAASKYPLGLVVVTPLLTSLLYLRRERWPAAAAAAVGMAGIGFLVGVPYSLIDIAGFLNGAGGEIYHYASGHRGAMAEPGLPQAIHYGGHFLSEFGAVGLALAVIGTAACIRADWRRAVILLIFPVWLMWILIGKRVNFTRNVLCVQPVIAMFAAYGAAAAHRWAVTAATHRGWMPARRAGWVSLGLTVILVAALLPSSHVRNTFRDHTDSRNVAEAWIAGHIPAEWAVVVPPQLAMDVRPLLARGSHVSVVDFAGNPSGLPAQLSDVEGPAIVLLPRWGADTRFPGSELAQSWNQATEGWQRLATFGANPVLVNYAQPVPDGDPAFSVAVLEHRFSTRGAPE